MNYYNKVKILNQILLNIGKIVWKPHIQKGIIIQISVLRFSFSI